MTTRGKQLTAKAVRAEVEGIDGGVQAITKEGHNTFRVVFSDGRVAIRFHHTNIITWTVNGSIVLNSGGWRTSTTKERLNRFLPSPWRITQDKGVWLLSNGDGTGYVFRDLILITPKDGVDGDGGNVKALRAMDKKISAYAAKYIKALYLGELQAPSGGDCWYCALKTQDGRTMGEAAKDTGHLESHMRDNYFVPSLLTRAVEAFPVSIAAMHTIGYFLKMHGERCEWFEGVSMGQIKKSLVRYIRRQFGLAA